jgi:hypothetical protein
VRAPLSPPVCLSVCQSLSLTSLILIRTFYNSRLFESQKVNFLESIIKTWRPYNRVRWKPHYHQAVQHPETIRSYSTRTSKSTQLLSRQFLRRSATIAMQPADVLLLTFGPTVITLILHNWVTGSTFQQLRIFQSHY